MNHLAHTLDEARKSLHRGRPVAAHSTLEGWLASPEPHLGSHSENQLADLMALMHTAAERGALALPSPARRLLSEALVRIEPARLLQLGASLVEAALPRLASGLLALAHQAFPSDERLLAQYVTALQLDGAHRTAWRVLEASPAHQSFLVAYLHAYEAIIGGHLEEARRLTATLDPGDDPPRRALRDRLSAMLRRHEVAAPRCRLDPHDARGWHFVLTGGLLLHVARDAHGEAQDGRYVHVRETPALTLEVLARLELVLAALGLPRLSPAPLAAVGAFEPHDQVDDRVLARALALRWQIDPRSDRDAGAPHLLVAYDLDPLTREARACLAAHRPGEVLFAQAASCAHEQRVTPDLVGYHYAQRTRAWATVVGPIDEEARAQQILDATLPSGALADVGELLDLARAAQAEGCLAALHGEGTREPPWVPERG